MSLFDDLSPEELEEEEMMDTLYHDASEEELRKMGCFDNLHLED